MRPVTIVLTLLAGPLLWGVSAAIEESANHVMPFVDDRSACLRCHTAPEMAAGAFDTFFPCDSLCLSCHENMAEHHPIGMPPPKPAASLGIRVRGEEIGCLSCHDLRTKRYDNRAWKAQSLFQRLTDSQRKHKTYFLVMPNTKGQLCKICH